MLQFNGYIFVLITTNVFTLSYDTETLLNAGICTLEARQSGDISYTANPAQQSFTVNPSQGGGTSSQNCDVPLRDWILILILIATGLLGISLRKRRNI